ncbi:unnamed protein product [Vitrella brassicaformis CCMP3155]|uniref:Uncharacterized protein n=5 Tax=Vitrella brassicaformis TaxID=1169539 RepID=A0A0G4H754_VITBC|nr:unnamed protein product [Vitrella brassicaformis CCMP3155]|eukprot:CEM39547.1 unnamed protein product [Vitrella brassicaformis CCMP3155]
MNPSADGDPPPRPCSAASRLEMRDAVSTTNTTPDTRTPREKRPEEDNSNKDKATARDAHIPPAYASSTGGSKLMRLFRSSAVHKVQAKAADKSHSGQPQSLAEALLGGGGREGGGRGSPSLRYREKEQQGEDNDTVTHAPDTVAPSGPFVWSKSNPPASPPIPPLPPSPIPHRLQPHPPSVPCLDSPKPTPAESLANQTPYRRVGKGLPQSSSGSGVAGAGGGAVLGGKQKGDGGGEGGDEEEGVWRQRLRDSLADGDNVWLLTNLRSFFDTYVTRADRVSELQRLILTPGGPRLIDLLLKALAFRPLLPSLLVHHVSAALWVTVFAHSNIPQRVRLIQQLRVCPDAIVSVAEHRIGCLALQHIVSLCSPRDVGTLLSELIVCHITRLAVHPLGSRLVRAFLVRSPPLDSWDVGTQLLTHAVQLSDSESGSSLLRQMILSAPHSASPSSRLHLRSHMLLSSRDMLTTRYGPSLIKDFIMCFDDDAATMMCRRLVAMEDEASDSNMLDVPAICSLQSMASDRDMAAILATLIARADQAARQALLAKVANMWRFDHPKRFGFVTARYAHVVIKATLPHLDVPALTSLHDASDRYVRPGLVWGEDCLSAKWDAISRITQVVTSTLPAKGLTHYRSKPPMTHREKNLGCPTPGPSDFVSMRSPHSPSLTSPARSGQSSTPPRGSEAAAMGAAGMSPLPVVTPSPPAASFPSPSSESPSSHSSHVMKAGRKSSSRLTDKPRHHGSPPPDVSPSSPDPYLSPDGWYSPRQSADDHDHPHATTSTVDEIQACLERILESDGSEGDRQQLAKKLEEALIQGQTVCYEAAEEGERGEGGGEEDGAALSHEPAIATATPESGESPAMASPSGETTDGVATAKAEEKAHLEKLIVSMSLKAAMANISSSPQHAAPQNAPTLPGGSDHTEVDGAVPEMPINDRIMHIFHQAEKRRAERDRLAMEANRNHPYEEDDSPVPPPPPPPPPPPYYANDTPTSSSYRSSTKDRPKRTLQRYRARTGTDNRGAGRPKQGGGGGRHQHHHVAASGDEDTDRPKNAPWATGPQSEGRTLFRRGWGGRGGTGLFYRQKQQKRQ